MRPSMILVLVLLTGSLAFSQSSSAQKASIGTGPWWRNPDYFKQLGLSDKQVQALEKTFTDHTSKVSDLNAEYQKLHLQLDSQFHTETRDEDISSTIDKLAQNRAKLISESYLLWVDERKILSPQQWRQMMALRDASRYEAAPSGSSPK